MKGRINMNRETAKTVFKVTLPSTNTLLAVSVSPSTGGIEAIKM